MNVSLVSYRDLGKDISQPFTTTAHVFHQRGILERVYTRGVIQTELPDDRISTHVPVVGRLPFSALYYVDKYLYGFDHRTVSTRAVDVILSKKIGNDEADIHYYDLTFLDKAVSKSSEHKTAVVRGNVPSLHGEIELMSAELEQSDIDTDIYQGQVARADRQHATLTEADKIIALSEHVKSSYEDHGVDPEKISVVNNGVNTDKYSNAVMSPDSGVDVLYVGQLSPRKGIHYLLDAWSEIERPIDELTLCGSPQRGFEPVLESYDFSDIRTPGWVDPVPYYHDATVFVLPSLAEGFAKVILEAMSTGTPVVVSENTGGADVIENGKNGFVVPIQDSDAIADRIQYFQENPEEAERMGENARETAESYTWEKQIDKIIDVLAE